VVNDARRRLETAIRGDGKHGHASTRVIGDQYVATRDIEADVARVSAVGELTIQGSQSAAIRIPDERGHAALVQFVDRVEIALPVVQG
jgi:hypothetical protein